MATFGERLKELRKAKKMSMRALATKIGVSDGAICRWEADERTLRDDDILVQLTEIFGVTITYMKGMSQ